MQEITISASWLNEHDYCEYKFYRRYVISSFQNSIKAENLTAAWDKLENKYGRGAVFTGMNKDK